MKQPTQQKKRRGVAQCVCNSSAFEDKEPRLSHLTSFPLPVCVPLFFFFFSYNCVDDATPSLYFALSFGGPPPQAYKSSKHIFFSGSEDNTFTAQISPSLKKPNYCSSCSLLPVLQRHTHTHIHAHVTLSASFSPAFLADNTHTRKKKERKEMDDVQLQAQSPASPLSPLPDKAAQRKKTPKRRSRIAQMTPEAETQLPPASSLGEKTAVQNPTSMSFRAHVASTIHYLASEVSGHSGGPHSTSNSNASNTSQTSSQTSEPPLTHARPPASPEEVDEQLDRILYAINQLQQLQRRGRYIAAREVRNLRRAYLFAVGEEQLYREALQAEAEGTNMTSAASPAPTTPAKQQQHHGLAGSSKQLWGRAAPAEGAPERPREDGEKPQQLSKEQNAQSNNVSSGASASSQSAAPTWLVKADRPAGTSSPASPPPPPPQPALNAAAAECPRAGDSSRVEYSPKAAAANRLLTALEQYVDETPTSASFDVNGARFSWRSIIDTPGERRLQTLVVSLFIFFTGIPISFAIFFLLMLSRYTAPLMVLYFIWMFTFGRPNHPHAKNWRFAHLAIWRYYRDYFPVRLVVPRSVRRKVEKDRNYFFVYHPHGVHTFGALLNFGVDSNDLRDMLPNITVHVQTLKANLFVPFWRQLTIWMGCGDASSSCIRKTLRSGPGQSIMLVVGGAEESLMAKPNANDLLLFKRKGFIKIALQEGTPLVPVYGFGENNVYNVADIAKAPGVQRLLELFKRYAGFAIPLVRGRGFFNFSFGILPHRRPIVVVIGEPIEVPRIAKPTAQDLDKWQARYIEGLRKLFDEHRGIYDLEATGLRIIR